jgi:hypothetical protein
VEREDRQPGAAQAGVGVMNEAGTEKAATVTFAKPFHRNLRGIKDGPNSGYSSWTYGDDRYIEDREYAKNPEHYVRAFTLIQNDLKSIFEYLEPSDVCREAYSYRIHALLMRTCIEVEADWIAKAREAAPG